MKNRAASKGSQAGRQRIGVGATLAIDIASTLMRILVYLLLFLILASLLSGLIHLVRDRGQGDRAVQALTWRIALSVVLFLVLMAGYYLGLFPPNAS